MKLSRKKERELKLKKFERERLLSKIAFPGPMELIIVLDGLKSDFNIGKIFRSAEAFGVQRICLIGIQDFDPYPAKGSFKKVPSHFFNNPQDCINFLKQMGHELFLFDSQATQLINQAQIPKKSAFFFFHEEFGPSDFYKNSNFNSLKIKQVGKTESLNVSVAASIAIYQYSLNFPVI